MLEPPLVFRFVHRYSSDEGLGFRPMRRRGAGISAFPLPRENKQDGEGGFAFYFRKGKSPVRFPSCRHVFSMSESV
jgi:hypothetical protein